MKLAASIKEIVNTKNLSEELVVDVVKSVFEESYKEIFGAQDIDFKIDLEKNIFQVLIVKEIVKRVRDPRIQLNTKQAAAILNVKEVPENLESLAIPYNPVEDFSPTEIMKISQAILNKIKDYEHNSIEYELSQKKIKLISGTIVKITPNGNIFVDIGKTLACLPLSEQSPLEHYENGDTIKTIVSKVENTSPHRNRQKLQVTLSRKSPNLVKELLRIEIPEVSDDIIEVKSIARIAGYKTKILVETQANIDPVGACIGPHGIRIISIIKEIGGEKIDIIRYSENKKELINSALTPARVDQIILAEGEDGNEIAYAITPEDQLPYIFGKQKKNIILASKLCNIQILVKTPQEAIEEGLQEEGMRELESMFGTNISELNLPDTLVQKIHENQIFSIEDLVDVHINNRYVDFLNLSDDEIELIKTEITNNVEIDETSSSTEESEENTNEHATPLNAIPDLKEEWIELLEKEEITSIEGLVHAVNNNQLESIESIPQEDKEAIIQILMDSIEIES